MTVKLGDLFAAADLKQAIDAGYVRVQQHAALPYRIFNYTETCQWESAWNDVTRTCRGLIVDGDGKHNHHELNAPTIGMDEPVGVTDKIDGSLGVLYPTPDGFAIATRGSFASEQAEHATVLWRKQYAGNVVVPDGITPLFEIVYPANRIVIDYGGMDDLVLLAGMEIDSGAYVDPRLMAKRMWWPGPITETFDFPNYASALAAPPRADREGFVVRSLESGATVKVKQEDYVALHRIVTGLNARTVWEQMGGPTNDIGKLVGDLPDEFHGWVADVAADLSGRCWEAVAAAKADYSAIVAKLPYGWTRKDLAMIAKERDNRALLFLVADDRDPTAQVWKSLRPSADWRPTNLRAQSEDAA